MGSNVDTQPINRVLVTGAAGRTGRLVYEKLKQIDHFEPVALVQSEKSARSLIKNCEKCGLEDVFVCDIVDGLDIENPPEGMEAIDSMIICTSAVPIISKRSLVLAGLKIPINLARGRKALDVRLLRFKFKRGQCPEKVDFIGQKAQIDLAKKLGMKKVVVVSSMGSNDPDHFLNAVGKNPDGSGGDILLWKRKAEEELINSGLSYTIIRPGILTDGQAGVKDIILDADDKLTSCQEKSIARADVANLCAAALTVGMAKNVSLDCISRVSDDGSLPLSAEDALKAFITEGETANKSL